MYYTWSHYHEELSLCKRAIELEPTSLPSYYNLGAAYNGAGLYREAEKNLLKSLFNVGQSTRTHS